MHLQVECVFDIIPLHGNVRRRYRRFNLMVVQLCLLALLAGCAAHGKKTGDEFATEDIRWRDVSEALREKESEKARELLSAALRNDPRNGYLHLLNGLSYRLSDRSQQSQDLARVGYDAAVKFSPGYLWSHYFSGLTSLERKEYPAAAEQFSRAILDNPDCPYAFEALAIAAYYAGDLGVARIAAERALALAPENPMMARTAAYTAAASGDQARLSVLLNKMKQLPASKTDFGIQDQRLTQLLRVATLAGGESNKEPSPPDTQVSASNGSAATEDPKQVMIEVTLLLSQDATKRKIGINLLDGLWLQFGLDYQTKDEHVSGGSNTLSQVLTTALQVPQIAYSLNLFNTHDDFYDIVVRPSLVASLNEQSEFFIGRTLNVGISGINTGLLQTIDVGTSVKVTPLTITQERTKFRVDTVRSFFVPDSSGTFTESVTTFKQTVGATVEVDFGKTLILSGLYETVDVGWTSKTPLLGSIPAVNTLFNERSHTQSRDAAIVLVTPRLPGIIETGTHEFRTETLNRMLSLWKELVDPIANTDALIHLMEVKISKYFAPQAGDLKIPSAADSEIVNLAINETIERL